MIIKDFHNVRFPEDISYGSSGGPSFKTTILELASGHEQRNIDWSLARANYDASYGIKTREQMEDVLDFFYARRGQAYGFRFKDWMDYSIDRQQIGVVAGDNKFTLQIYKRYEPLTSFYYDRPILKLVPGSVKLWVNNVDRTNAFGTTIDNETGIVSTISNYTPGHVVEIECEFDVPVRFNTDDIQIAHDDWELMSWPSIPLIELKPRAA